MWRTHFETTNICRKVFGPPSLYEKNTKILFLSCLRGSVPPRKCAAERGRASMSWSKQKAVAKIARMIPIIGNMLTLQWWPLLSGPMNWLLISRGRHQSFLQSKQKKPSIQNRCFLKTSYRGNNPILGALGLFLSLTHSSEFRLLGWTAVTQLGVPAKANSGRSN